MIVSLNEVESLSLKAARGAGMSWGLAEEAAYAARWLAFRGWAWDRSFIEILQRRADVSPPLLMGSSICGDREGAAVCPIHAGAALADLLRVRESITLHRVLAPLWLLPFAHRLAAKQCDVRITWANGHCVLNVADALIGDAVRLPAAIVDWISVEMLQPCSRSGDAPIQAVGSTVDQAAWDALERWAARTYVPASVQSRLAGAGAGLSDND